MAELAEGAVIDGRYRVISRVGSGGMADVFLAEDQQLGRKVAVKLLHHRFAEDPGFVERFRREAQAAAGLQHPNVVGVYDRGAHDGTYYIAMEYLPGRSLKQLIRQEAPIDPVRAIEISAQILKAARFAHRRGVIHRDLKPHNVIVDDSDRAKVTDFGIARAGASDMTETGSIMGTAQYLSPEQAQGHAVSAVSDLYSVGVVLYELLTGRVPFDGDAAVTIALKHVSEAPVPPSAINPAVPPEVEQVVLWALNKNPADRPADADQFLAALDQAKTAILAHSSGQRTASVAAVTAVGVPVSRTAPAAPVRASPSFSAAAAGAIPAAVAQDTGFGDTQAPAPLRPRPERRRWPWVVVLVLLLAAGAGAAAYLLTRPVKEVVPTVVGEQLTVAEAQIQNASLAVSVIDVTGAEPAGTVIRQDPLGGAKAKEGSTVALTVSQGPGDATVPPVFGLSERQAQAAISQAGLKWRVQTESSPTLPAGEAIETDPASGQSVPVGNRVVLLVSSGKPPVTVPDVSDLAQATAEADLVNAGLTVGVVTTQPSSTIPPGNVITLSPSANAQVPVGSAVNLVIAGNTSTTSSSSSTTPTSSSSSTTPTASATVPATKGDTEAQATTVLSNAGYRIRVRTKDTTRRDQDGIVLSQTPSAGAADGSTVTIVVGKYKPQASTSTTGSLTSSTTSTASTSTASTPTTTSTTSST